MRIDWCKILGHKWVPIIIGFKDRDYTFIGCYCDRCRLGDNELHKAVADQTTVIASYNFEYFKKQRE